MFSVRSLLLLVVAFLSGTQVQHFFFRPFWSTGSHSLTIAHASPAAQALLLQPAGHMGLASACSPAAARVGDIAMARRTNLKKEKRARNRINAFRFKKGGFTKRRFFGPDAAAEQKKADEDNQFYSMVRTPPLKPPPTPPPARPRSARRSRRTPAVVCLRRSSPTARRRRRSPRRRRRRRPRSRRRLEHGSIRNHGSSQREGGAHACGLHAASPRRRPL